MNKCAARKAAHFFFERTMVEVGLLWVLAQQLRSSEAQQLL
jgi:hypothetical protein